MIANYHTHTWRCSHAEGTEQEYVDLALEAGLKILGFSDHAPYIFPEGFDSWFRMKPEQLPGYVDTVLSLREAYRGKIEIPLGLEMEYYPALFPRMLPILRDHPIDYLLLGQHFLGNEYDDHYSGRGARDKAHLQRYCDQCIDAMQTGLFTYFAHPDLVRFVGDDRFYREQMRRLCREARSCDIPLEINLLGILKGKHYPDTRLWEAAGEEGCRVILGRDAHDPRQFLETSYEEKAMELVRQYDLKLLDTVKFRKI